LKLQVVLAEGPETDNDDIIAYAAARLLVRNGKPIEFVSNCEPELTSLAEAGLDDWDQKDINLCSSVGHPPHESEDVQYLIAGHGRKMSEVIELITRYARLLAAGPSGRLAIVWVLRPDQAERFCAEYRDQLKGSTDILYLETVLCFEDDEFVFTPAVGVRFKVARSGLSKSLSIVIQDLEDLDRTFEH